MFVVNTVECYVHEKMRIVGHVGQLFIKSHVIANGPQSDLMCTV